MAVDFFTVEAFFQRKRPNRAKKGRADDFLRKWNFSDMNPFKLFGSMMELFRFSQGKREGDLPLKFQNT